MVFKLFLYAETNTPYYILGEDYIGCTIFPWNNFYILECSFKHKLEGIQEYYFK